MEDNLNIEEKNVDYLNDYQRVMVLIKDINETCGETIDIETVYEDSKKEYENIESLFNSLSQEEYQKIKEIQLTTLSSDDIATEFILDKENNKITILKEKDNELNDMINDKEIDYSSIAIDPNCTYYNFKDMGVIGKYNQKTSEYFELNEKNKWKSSGRIMRWVFDPQYDYEIIKPEGKVKK